MHDIVRNACRPLIHTDFDFAEDTPSDATRACDKSVLMQEMRSLGTHFRLLVHALHLHLSQGKLSDRCFFERQRRAQGFSLTSADCKGAEIRVQPGRNS